MTNEELRLKSCIEQIRAKTDFVPTIGIVLGSGLGEYGRKIYTEVEISYSEIQGFPQCRGMPEDIYLEKSGRCL